MNKREDIGLRVLVVLAILVSAAAIVAACKMFDYRAGGIVFCGIGAALIAFECMVRLDEARFWDDVEALKQWLEEQANDQDREG